MQSCGGQAATAAPKGGLKHSLVVPTTTDEDLFRPRITTRRKILAGGASLVMTGWVSAAQRPFRLGYLVPASPAANELNRRALFGALAELGYREGHNLVVERRFADGRQGRERRLAVVPRKDFPRLSTLFEQGLFSGSGDDDAIGWAVDVIVGGILANKHRG